MDDTTDDTEAGTEDDGMGNVVAGPFGGMSPQEAAQKAVAARERKREERKKAAEKARKQLRELVNTKLAELPAVDEHTLAEMAEGVAKMMAAHLLTGAIEIRNGTEAARVAEAFFHIMRLEQGQATSITDGITKEDQRALIAEFTERIKARQAAS